MTEPVNTSSSPNQGSATSSSNTPATAVNGQEPERPAPTENDEHPELDDFVKGFYDGGGFSDVDNRVWVTST